MVYGPVTEGAQQSVIFRLVAQPPPAEDITVLFSTMSQSAIGTHCVHVQHVTGACIHTSCVHIISLSHYIPK